MREPKPSGGFQDKQKERLEDHKASGRKRIEDKKKGKCQPSGNSAQERNDLKEAKLEADLKRIFENLAAHSKSEFLVKDKNLKQEIDDFLNKQKNISVTDVKRLKTIVKIGSKLVEKFFQLEQVLQRQARDQAVLEDMEKKEDENLLIQEKEAKNLWAMLSKVLKNKRTTTFVKQEIREFFIASQALAVLDDENKKTEIGVGEWRKRYSEALKLFILGGGRILRGLESRPDQEDMKEIVQNNKLWGEKFWELKDELDSDKLKELAVSGDYLAIGRGKKEFVGQSIAATADDYDLWKKEQDKKEQNIVSNDPNIQVAPVEQAGPETKPQKTYFSDQQKEVLIKGLASFIKDKAKKEPPLPRTRDTVPPQRHVQGKDFKSLAEHMSRVGDMFRLAGEGEVEEGVLEWENARVAARGNISPTVNTEKKPPEREEIDVTNEALSGANNTAISAQEKSRPANIPKPVERRLSDKEAEMLKKAAASGDFDVAVDVNAGSKEVSTFHPQKFGIASGENVIRQNGDGKIISTEETIQNYDFPEFSDSDYVVKGIKKESIISGREADEIARLVVRDRLPEKGLDKGATSLDSINNPKEHKQAVERLLDRFIVLKEMPSELTYFLSPQDYGQRESFINNGFDQKFLAKLSTGEIDETEKKMKEIIKAAHDNQKENWERVANGVLIAGDMVRVFINGQYENDWIIKEVDENDGMVTAHRMGESFLNHDFSLDTLAQWQINPGETAIEKEGGELKERFLAVRQEADKLLSVLKKHHDFSNFSENDPVGLAIQQYYADVKKINSPDFDFDNPANTQIYLDFVERRTPGLINNIKDFFNDKKIDYSLETTEENKNNIESGTAEKKSMVGSKDAIESLVDQAKQLSVLSEEMFGFIKNKWPEFPLEKEVYLLREDVSNAREWYQREATLENIETLVRAEQKYKDLLDLIKRYLAAPKEKNKDIREIINEAKIRMAMPGADYEELTKPLQQAKFANSKEFFRDQRVVEEISQLLKEILTSGSGLNNLAKNFLDLTGLDQDDIYRSIDRREQELTELAKQLGRTDTKRGFWSKLKGAGKVTGKIGMYAGIGTVATLATGGVGGALSMGVVRMIDAKISGGRSERELSDNLKKIKREISKDSPEGQQWLNLLVANLTADLAISKQHQIDRQERVFADFDQEKNKARKNNDYVRYEKLIDMQSSVYLDDIRKKLENTEMPAENIDKILDQVRALLAVDRSTAVMEAKIADRAPGVLEKSFSWLDRVLPDSLKSLWSGGTTAKEKMKTAAVFTFAGMLARTMPAVRQGLFAYSGAKAFESAAILATSKMGGFRELGFITAEQLNKDNVNDQLMARARAQLLDQKFKKQHPGDYVRLREKVEYFTTLKIKNAKKLTETVQQITNDLESNFLRRKNLEKHRKIIIGASQAVGAAAGALLGPEAIQELGQWLGGDHTVKPVFQSQASKDVFREISENKTLSQVRGFSQQVAGSLREVAGVIGNDTGVKTLSDWAGQSTAEVMPKLSILSEDTVNNIAKDGRINEQEIVSLVKLDENLQRAALPESFVGGINNIEGVNEVNQRLDDVFSIVKDISDDTEKSNIINSLANSGLQKEQIEAAGTLVANLHGKISQQVEGYTVSAIAKDGFSPEAISRVSGLVETATKIKSPEIQIALLEKLSRGGIEPETASQLNEAIAAVKNLPEGSREYVVYGLVKDGIFDQSDRNVVDVISKISALPNADQDIINYILQTDNAALILQNMEKALGGPGSLSGDSSRESLEELNKIFAKGDFKEIDNIIQTNRVAVVKQGDTLTKILHDQLDEKSSNYDSRLATAFVKNYLGEDVLSGDGDEVNQSLIDKAIGVAAAREENLAYAGNRMIIANNGAIDIIKGVGVADARRVSEETLRLNYLQERLQVNRDTIQSIKIGPDKSFIFQSNGRAFRVDGAGSKNVLVKALDGSGSGVYLSDDGKLVKAEGLRLPEGKTNNFGDILQNYDQYSAPSPEINIESINTEDITRVLTNEGVEISDAAKLEVLNPAEYGITVSSEQNLRLARVETEGGSKVYVMFGSEVVHAQTLAEVSINKTDVRNINQYIKEIIDIRDSVTKEYQIDNSKANQLISDVRFAVDHYLGEPKIEEVSRFVEKSGGDVNLLGNRSQCEIAQNLIKESYNPNEIRSGLEFSQSLRSVDAKKGFILASIYANPSVNNLHLREFLNVGGLEFDDEPMITAKHGRLEISGLHAAGYDSGARDDLIIDSKTSSVKINRIGKDQYFPASHLDTAIRAIVADTEGVITTNAENIIREEFVTDSQAQKFIETWIDTERFSVDFIKTSNAKTYIDALLSSRGFNLGQYSLGENAVIKSIEENKADNSIGFEVSAPGRDVRYTFFPDRNIVLREAGTFVRNTEIIGSPADFETRLNIDVGEGQEYNEKP
ncbi:MAG: hypothetical protein WC310_05140 [Patescibacteria group bacterium]|jgi:hypothetical protein